jgi:hypothetical protein
VSEQSAKLFGQRAELFGRGRVLRFVAEALDRSHDRVTPPVVLLIGPGGAGKTVVLDRLEAVHRAGVPLARLDFEHNEEATPAQVMLGVGTLLHSHVPRVGRTSFPRLSLGIIALTLEADNDSAVTAAEQLRQRLRSRGGISGQAIAGLAAQAAKLLPASEQQAMLSDAGAIVGWIIDGIRGRQLSRHLAWYSRNVAHDNPTDLGGLLALNARWRTVVEKGDTRARRDVWRALCGALLADLRARFGSAGLWHGNLTTNCLLLLDNVDCAAGEDLLETLAELRRADPAQADPLLVVAAMGTRPRLVPRVGGAVDAADERLSYATWLAQPHDPEFPRSPWYPVRLGELEKNNISRIVGSHVLGKVEHDVDLVASVSGGHSASVWELARVLEGAPDGFDPRGLLSPTVEDTLLGLLRPTWQDDHELRKLKAMAVFGATQRPKDKAGVAVFRALRQELGEVEATDIRELFLDRMWGEGEDAISIRPLPRLLLSRLLARDPGLWEKAHESFLAFYRSRDARDVIAENYHLLALTTSLSAGHLNTVAAYLNGRLEHQTSGSWNDALEAITEAPNRLWRTFAEHRAAGIDAIFDLRGDPREVVTKVAGASAGDRTRMIARLVTGLWLFNDRLFDPARSLADMLAKAYVDLADVAPVDSAVFYGRARHFRRIARYWEDRL